MLFPFFIGYSITDYALKCKKRANDLNEQLKRCKNPKEKKELELERDKMMQRCVDIQGLPIFPLILSRPEEDYLSSRRKEFPTKKEIADWWTVRRKREKIIAYGIAIAFWGYVIFQMVKPSLK